MRIDEYLKIRPISIKDTDFIVDSRNLTEIADNFFSDIPTYDFLHNKWLGMFENSLDYIIEYKKEKAGRIIISDIDYRNKKAEYGIYLLKNYQGNGIAYKTSEYVLRYVFNNFNLQKIYLNVFSENKVAIKLYKNLKFSEEGLFEKEIFKNGKYRDVIRMAVFSEEFLK